MRPTIKLLTAALIILFSGSSALAVVNSVPDFFPTIQEAIDASDNGDTVLVQPGTYVENIDFNGNAITLGSLFLTTEDESYISQTVIDGNGNGSVVTILNADGDGTALTGFTIQNGNTDNGGGIFCMSASPTISYCHIRDNTGLAGGGLLAVEGDPTISYCTVSGNTANTGGGMFFVDANPLIINCTISGNTAMEEGGGVFGFESDITIENCILWGNIPDEAALAAGGDTSGISVSNSDVQGGEEGITTNDNGDVDWGEDNIDEDPQFEDPENGDFSLSEDSPCLDLNMGPNPPEELTPVARIRVLITRIDEMVYTGELNRHCGNFLKLKLNLAIKRLNRDRARIAVFSLRRFETRVAFLMRRGVLPREDGVAMTRTVNEIISQLCGVGGDGLEELDLTLDEPVPANHYLSQNHPNPFNATTKLSYGLPEASRVRIAVYDMAGRLVANLVDGVQAAGDYTAQWDGQNAPTGLYIIRMESGGFNAVRSMMLTK